MGLSARGNFTVFAPNDAAFAALPAGTLESLLKPENKDQLVDILTYHVLPSQVLSTDLKFFQRLDTVEGKKLHVASVPLGGGAKLVQGWKLLLLVLTIWQATGLCTLLTLSCCPLTTLSLCRQRCRTKEFGFSFSFIFGARLLSAPKFSMGGMPVHISDVFFA